MFNPQEQIKQLTERKYELEAEEAKNSLSPEEQVEQLKAKIKRDNAENDRLQAQIRSLVEAVKKMEAQVASVKPANDTKPAAPVSMDTGEDNQQKYEELLAKEQDLNSFLGRFESQLADRKAGIVEKQEAIIAKLEKLSKAAQVVSSGGTLPDTGKFREMQDELEYKKIQVQNAQSTQVILYEPCNAL